MAQRFRVQELKIKSGLANRSGIVTDNFNSSTPNKLVGTQFKSVLVNETGEFVAGPEGGYTSEVSRIHFDVGTLTTGSIYPSYNGSIPAAEKYMSVELPAPATLLTLSEIKVILHNDTTRTTIVLNLRKNGVSFQTLTLPNGTSTLTVTNTTTFVDGDKFSVEVTTGLSISNTIGTEIFLTHILS